MSDARIVTLPFDVYLADPAYSASDVRAFKCGPPAMVPWRREHRDHIGTGATCIGRAAHCAILTPDLFAETTALKPADMTFRSKENKAIRDRWLAEGRTILDADEAEQIDAIRHAFFDKSPAAESLRGALGVERSIFWTCDDSGLPCKGRPDWFTADAVYDLKVSIAAEKEPDRLAFTAHANGWLNQLAHYRAGLHAAGYRDVRVGRLVVIAPNPPQAFRVWLLEVKEADMDFLELDNSNTRRAMAVCHRRGHWPGTPDQWQPIELPASAAFTESDLEGAEELPI